MFVFKKCQEEKVLKSRHKRNSYSESKFRIIYSKLMFGEGKKKVQGNAEKTSSNLANVLDKKATLHLALGTPCSLCCMNSQTEELYGFLYSDRVCSC